MTITSIKTKKLLYLALVFFCWWLSPVAHAGTQCLAVFDVFDADELPRNYRSTNQRECLRHKAISTMGLEYLHASGSAQFSEQQLKNILHVIPAAAVIDIDLRQESHGFVNGNAVSLKGMNNWGNVGKTSQQIQRSELPPEIRTGC